MAIWLFYVAGSYISSCVYLLNSVFIILYESGKLHTCDFVMRSLRSIFSNAKLYKPLRENKVFSGCQNEVNKCSSGACLRINKVNSEWYRVHAAIYTW